MDPVPFDCPQSTKRPVRRRYSISIVALPRAHSTVVYWAPRILACQDARHDPESF